MHENTPFPGPRSAEMLEELSRYVINDQWPFVVDLERSEGLWLATVDGQRIFDWAGLYGAMLLGYNYRHPLLEDPGYRERLLRAASNKMANPDFLTRECLDYYRLLHENAPRSMRGEALEVYAVNSGAEAVENMLKYFTNLHHHKLMAKGRMPGTRRFLYFNEAFHGRTVFTLNVTRLTANAIITKDFHHFMPGNLQVPFPAMDTDLPARENEARAKRCLESVEYLLKLHADEIVGIVVEPIQGAGGHRMATHSFFQGLSELAHRHDVFLGFDEVQTAGGQTGSLFAIDDFDLPHPPQAVAVAKKFGCGAVFMRHTMQDCGVLDSTWGGHLADMVRVVREFEVIRQERLMEAVPEKEARLVSGLQALQRDFPGQVRNIRGMGLYQGFTCLDASACSELKAWMLDEEQTLLLGAGPDTIRLRPPITVTVEEIDLLLARLRKGFER